MVLNRGNTPTLRRPDQTSIIDLTLATQNVAGRLVDWAGLPCESLSDHLYIFFMINFDQPLLQLPIREKLGWQPKKIDCEKLKGAIDSKRRLGDIAGVNNFSKILKDLCNPSMPKKKTVRGRRPV